MCAKISRRSFLKTSAAIGVGSAMAGSLGNKQARGDIVADIIVVEGKDWLQNTKTAVALLGGMKKFVPQNSRVALLANVQSYNPGTYTKPEILRAAIQMCKEAGAAEIGCIGWLRERNWRYTGCKKVIDEEEVKLEITDARDESLFRPVPVPRGINLKEARIIETYFRYDVLIDMNITKEHSGNNFSGTMKNLMGINSPKSNQTCHRREWNLVMEDAEHLDQCIADLNTIIHPALCIIDATEFVTTNGPDGPGKLLRPQKIIAGTDRLAIDTYCSKLFGYDPADIIVLGRAYAHRLGEIDLTKVAIKEIVG